MKRKKLFSLLASLSLINSCATKQPERTIASEDTGIEFDSRRGSPAEYDPGAPLNSEWFKLFGETPNYRAIGVKALNGTAMTDEKFRWEFGPMWYRGRLTPQDVKVFVVGQEGAQDENISNRAFTGSTGTRVQKFLNHLGIYHSYLFLNTFVYTINGQLDDDPTFKWLEQGTGAQDVESSPIVEYRHKLFDQMLKTNNESVALFMGVGSGGKASLATWINARGGKCSTDFDMKSCDTTGMQDWFLKNRNIEIKNKILAVGVPHPGGANPNLGGTAQLENIKKGFTEAARRVAKFKNENPGWLTQDAEEKISAAELSDRMNNEYIYKGYAPIPFRDFAFGTNWRMGSEGTTSNRWGASSIQVYSDAGEYNDKNSTYVKPSDKDSGLNSTKTALKEMSNEDLAYEHPRYTNDLELKDMNYDYGPCGYVTLSQPSCELSKALVSWPDFTKISLNPISHKSFGYFGTYRGHALNSRVFILADQASLDDFFAARALTGTEGQKLQTILDKLNLKNQYFILRTFPVDVAGIDNGILLKTALNPNVMDTYQRIFEAVKSQANIQAVVGLGPVASVVIQNIFGSENLNFKVIPIADLNDYADTNAKIKTLAKTLQENLDSTYKFKGELTTIPRSDLPYNTRWWMGSSGDRAARGEGPALGNYYRVWAPYWVSKLQPKNLSTEESQKLSSGLQLLKSKVKSKSSDQQ